VNLNRLRRLAALTALLQAGLAGAAAMNMRVFQIRVTTLPATDCKPNEQSVAPCGKLSPIPTGSQFTLHETIRALRHQLIVSLRLLSPGALR
jgi:hypothetical protein